MTTPVNPEESEGDRNTRQALVRQVQRTIGLLGEASDELSLLLVELEREDEESTGE